MAPNPPTIGRLAPSPTGAQHLGNARTYLVAWMLTRCNQGKLYLRVEDLDTPRTKAGAESLLLEDLRWLGLTWDRMEEVDATAVSGQSDQAREIFWGKSLRERGYVLQSERLARYQTILETLREKEVIYPCTCTRSEIEQSASAPHEPTPGEGSSTLMPHPVDGPVYPGTCSYRTACDAERLDAQGLKYAWRFRFSSIAALPSGATEIDRETLRMTWWDDFLGKQSLAPIQSLGDFVVARNYGPPAYQLAVVVDDHDMGINQVVRGADLVSSTYRQLALYGSMGWAPPRWFHAPLVVGPDGRRLAKRHGDTRLCTLRDEGYSNRLILGFLANSLGWIDRPEEIDLGELESMLRQDRTLLDRIPKDPVQVLLPRPA
ncbi:Glutamate--tRNA ligase 1 [Pirellula sp. SH-Sr6A]|uniref:tRNA glutamyl-Q(34) synthetase GluQRS n=1 Tax=Pirellula sp. SH-Sr6A TaxID=1632865 RepID=UPI00078C392B|nr:tRNA glutamyl-Q(34) synthetase GluQRS [Pirellula sp. SH-Sr6A]AMV34615.1 Glutamate--tRNA ligase 1 [Pirellula sp. SH-Sr6A]